MSLFEVLIVQPIFNMLLGFYSLVGDFGVAVIIFTIVVRFAMWPLVVKQLHQVKAMKKLQPELAKIKKSAKGNKQLEGIQMLELYKKHDVKPFRSILMLLIQLPIFIALYRVIQIFTSHRDLIASFTYGFMNNIQVVASLVEDPDTFNKYFLGFVDITTTAVNDSGVNVFLLLLAAGAAAVQYVVSKQTNTQASTKRLRDVIAEAGPNGQPDQAELNAIVMSKMIKILPIFMFLIMIGLPGALPLYYVTSNLFAAAQQHSLLKRDEEELEQIAESAIKKESPKRRGDVKKPNKSKDSHITHIKAKEGRRK